MECSICNTTFKTKTNYKKHLKTKRHLKRSNEVSPLKCLCGKIYSFRESLCIHRKTCTIYQTSLKSNVTINAMQEKLEKYEQEKTEMQSKYEKEREEMRAQIALLLERNAGNGTTTNTTNIDTQNNTINIHINAFGKENVEYLDDKTIAACIERVYKSIPAILEKIHFDPKHPENHNIKITNKKLPYATIMGDNQKWKTVDRKSAIETMVYNGYNLLDEKYPDVKPLIPDSKQSHFEGFQEKFFDDDNKQLNKQLKNDVELLVLNQ